MSTPPLGSRLAGWGPVFRLSQVKTPLVLFRSRAQRVTGGAQRRPYFLFGAERSDAFPLGTRASVGPNPYLGERVTGDHVDMTVAFPLPVPVASASPFDVGPVEERGAGILRTLPSITADGQRGRDGGWSSPGRSPRRPVQSRLLSVESAARLPPEYLSRPAESRENSLRSCPSAAPAS